MSKDKLRDSQEAQQEQALPRADLDAQYKGIGIRAVSAAAAATKGPKPKAKTEQWT